MPTQHASASPIQEHQDITKCVLELGVVMIITQRMASIFASRSVSAIAAICRHWRRGNHGGQSVPATFHNLAKIPASGRLGLFRQHRSQHSPSPVASPPRHLPHSQIGNKIQGPAWGHLSRSRNHRRGNDRTRENKLQNVGEAAR